MTPHDRVPLTAGDLSVTVDPPRRWSSVLPENDRPIAAERAAWWRD